MRKISLGLCVAIFALSACKESFKKGEDGLEYKIVTSGGGETIKAGNFMQLHVAQLYNDGKKDSLLSDTRTSPQGAAFEVMDSASIPPSYYKILSQLRKGDSVVLRILVDSAFAKTPNDIPAFFKKGHYLMTTIKLLNIFKTREQADSARNIAMQEAAVKQKAVAEEQLKKDDKTLKDYFAKNNIQVTKGQLGTYVQILTPGTGPNADTSMVAKAFYTGKTLEGTTFDSNTDPKFNHTEPLLVNLTNEPSAGQKVIPGWEDGFKLLNKGAKAKFYVPSSLGYGAQGAGQDIKPNAILVFDVEVADLLTKSQAIALATAQQQKMQEMQKRYMDSMQKANPQMQQPNLPGN